MIVNAALADSDRQFNKARLDGTISIDKRL